MHTHTQTHLAMGCVQEDGGGAPKWFLHPPGNLRADASLGRLQQKKKTKEMRTQKKKTKRTKKKRTKKEMKKKTKEMRTKKEKKKTKEVRTHTGKEKKKEKKKSA
jgi:hypothetical protein